MNNKELIETTKEIVVSMINSKLLNANTANAVNERVLQSIDAVYNKLSELNSKEVKYGRSHPNT